MTETSLRLYENEHMM